MSLCEQQRSTRSHRTPRRQQDRSLERLRGSHFPDAGSTRRDCRMCSVRGPDGKRPHLSAQHVVIIHIYVLGSVLENTIHMEI